MLLPPFEPSHAKLTPYEGGVNVPLIISGPAVTNRGHSNGLVNTTDLLATTIELAGYQLDVYSVLPLGELWVAAARLRQTDRLAYALDDMWGLLARLGDPVLWSVPLHWAGVHAGILANDPEAVAPHGQALTAAAAHSAFAKALAMAGRTWLRVLAGQAVSPRCRSSRPPLAASP